MPTSPSPVESRWLGLECLLCSAPADEGATGPCPSCSGPLASRYEAAGFEPPPPAGRSEAGVFRWAGLLPVREPARRLGLGEADASFVGLPELARGLGLGGLELIRDAANPLGASSARGFAVAAAAWAERGAGSLTLASAGPSAGPFAAAAKRHGLPCRVALPSGASPGFRLEARLLKARVVAVLGDRGKAADWVEGHPGDDSDRVLSAFAEPFRLDGVKTLAFELWERHGSALPEVLVVPTGSGLALAALHRGFAELRAAGLLEGPEPRLIAAQVEACAPLVRALGEEAEDVAPWADSHRTLAESLRDPAPRGGRAALAALRAKGGAAAAVSEGALVDALRNAARHDGVLVGPEGAAALAAVAQLRAGGDLEGARVACLDPQALWRCPEALEAAGTG